MIRRDPKKNLKYAGGVPGGLNNPLGARAIYLYQNGNDTMFRIHGTNQPWSIGEAMSSGCVRMLNQDVIDLYARVQPGGRVHVIQGRRQA
jgi:lipoprotein-anchoring transpeptidase ErfK/SrfK